MRRTRIRTLEPMFAIQPPGVAVSEYLLPLGTVKAVDRGDKHFIPLLNADRGYRN